MTGVPRYVPPRPGQYDTGYTLLDFAKQVYGFPGEVYDDVDQTLRGLIDMGGDIAGGQTPYDAGLNPAKMGSDWFHQITNPVQYANEHPAMFMGDIAGLAGLGAHGAGFIGSHIDDVRPSLGRLLGEERGGTLGNPESLDARDLFSEATKKYQKQRQPELRGPIEERTPADLSPEGQGIRALLEEQLGQETYQSPTMGKGPAVRAEAEIRNTARLRRLMEETDYTGHNTPMKLREDASPHRPGSSKVGGEGVEDPYASLSERRSNSRNLRDFPADQALDKRTPHPQGDAFSYEAGVGIRDNLASPADVADEAYRYYAHETDAKNIEGIKKTGVEARWDPAEEGRHFVSARDWTEGDVPKGRARVKFRSKEEPMRRGGVNAVKFKKGIPPEDIVEIKRSTLDDLTNSLEREGTPEGHGRFVPDYKPKPNPRRVVPPTPPLNISGPTPFERGQR